MEDGWELTFGLDPLVDNSAEDNDGDGLTDLKEYLNGTNPNQPDLYPHIKANGSDVLVAIGTSDTLSLSVSVDAYSGLGVDSDWWVVVNTPFGWFHYDLPSGS